MIQPLTVASMMRASHWLDALILHDRDLCSHSLRVGELVAAFSIQLGFPSRDVEELTLAGLLHDVGKLEIDRAILRKTDALTEGEKALMRLHPETGCSMLDAEGEFSEVVLDVVRRHHERLDGSGYPDSIRGASISQAVRIVTICDVFAAMTDIRPYVHSFDWKTALAVMASKKTRLDQKLLTQFSSMLETKSSDLQYHPVASDHRSLVRHI